MGTVTLRVEGLDRQGGKVVRLAGEKTFYRSPSAFRGPYHQPAVTYRESARLALRTLFLKPVIQSWLREGKPDPAYALNCYPARKSWEPPSWA